MNIFNSIKSAINTVFPSAEGNFYPMTSTPFSVKSLSRKDYIRLYTGWQYVAVSTIAGSVAQLDYALTAGKDKDDEINHPHLDLIDYDLLETVVSSLQLTGSCYLYKNKVGSKVESLDHLRTDQVMLEENADGSLKGYRYSHKNKSNLYSPDEVMDISLFSPLKTYPYTVKGFSPMQAVAIQAEMDITSTRWNWNFFKNNASTGGTLETEHKISKDNKKRLIQKRKKEFQGVNNSNKIAVLDNGVQYKNQSVSQKELDFVESRRFTRDEVFAIFKVPKSIVGIVEDSNRANSLSDERTYYNVCISPIAVKIQEAFNRELFYGKGYFNFKNVVPEDTKKMLDNYNNGAITLNEYRASIGLPSVEGGDFLKINPLMVDSGNQFQVQKQAPKETASSSVKKIVRDTLKKNTKGTPEYKRNREEWGEKIWKQKIQRTDKYEITYIEKVRDIFQEQKARIMDAILEQKDVKTVERPPADLLSTTRRLVALTPLYKDVFVSEGNEALELAGIIGTFEIGNENVNKWIKKNIKRVAKDVDKHTKEKIYSVIAQGNKEGLGARDIARNVSEQFEEFSRNRAEKIARTEITTASNQAIQQSWEQSGRVSKKEWYTALDERVCPECNAMHQRVENLTGTFLDKGDSVNDVTFDYQDIE